MIDTRLLLDDFDETVRRLSRKKVDPSLPTEARRLAALRLDQIKAVDSVRQEMNAGSSRIGALVREGKRDEADVVKARMADLKERLEALETQLQVTEIDLEDAVMRIPNLPADDVPDGAGEEDNVVLRTVGYDPAAYEGRDWEPHWDIAGRLGLLDAERASKLSGPMFAVLRGPGAKILRGLVAMALDIHGETYEEIIPPHLVRTEVIAKTGHLTKFDTQAYTLRDDDLWLIPTGEVALMGLHQGEILAEAELTKRYMAYTTCWRREAGAAGKETRGLQRLHEFHKVELVKLCRPEDGEKEFQSLVADAARPLELLGLPYRVLELCTGDLTFSASRVVDLEVYSPGVDKWLEVSSISLVTDFQSRRGQIRFRREGGGIELVHALNGSGLATPRVWAALVEHGLRSDGSVVLPPALVPYAGIDVVPAAG